MGLGVRITGVLRILGNSKKHNKESNQMKKSLLALSLAAILLTGCDGPTKVTVTPDMSIAQISADTRHTMELDSDGNLYAVGWNEVGAMGDGIATGTTVMNPTIVFSDVESVDTGFNFTMVVKKDGTLWGTGENWGGQLGLGSMTDATVFTQAIDSNDNLMTGVASVYTGNSFTLALKDDGTLWVAGANGNGQLGLGDNADRTKFTQVIGLGSTVAKVATGDYHSIIVLTNGDILTAGDNNFGSLGNGANGGTVLAFTKVTDTATVGTVSHIAANQVGSFIVNSDGDLYVAGDNWASDGGTTYGTGGLGTGSTYSYHTFTKLSNISNIVGIEAKYTSVALATSDGKLLVSGNNSHGQLGTGTSADFITEFTEVSSTGVSAGERKISTGNYTGFYVTSAGVLYGAGDNWFGNLGNGLAGAGTGYTTFTAVTE